MSYRPTGNINKIQMGLLSRTTNSLHMEASITAAVHTSAEVFINSQVAKFIHLKRTPLGQSFQFYGQLQGAQENRSYCDDRNVDGVTVVSYNTGALLRPQLYTKWISYVSGIFLLATSSLTCCRVQWYYTTAWICDSMFILVQTGHTTHLNRY